MQTPTDSRTHLTAADKIHSCTRKESCILKKKLNELEEWCQNFKVGDISKLLRRSVIKLDPETGYRSLIDGIKITVGQSPSEVRRKTKRLLERLITTPGTTPEPVESEKIISIEDLQRAAITATNLLKKALWPEDTRRRVSNR